MAKQWLEDIVAQVDPNDVRKFLRSGRLGAF